MAYFKIKVIMLGSAESGKNNMSRKYFEGLNAVYQKNIGVEIYSRTFQLPSNEDVNISFWNCSSDSKYCLHISTFCRGSAGALIWFDITDRESYLETIKWAQYVKLAGKIPIVLIGNKVDLASNREVSYEEAKKFSEFGNFTAIHNYLLEHDKLLIYLGKGVHKIKKKAEQFACENVLNLLTPVTSETPEIK